RGIGRETTWSDLAARVAALACGLAREYRIAAGETVAIIGNPCPEWTIADLATQALGAITYGVYPTSAPGEVRHLLQHGGASLIVAEDQEHLDKTLEVLDECPNVRAVAMLPLCHAMGRNLAITMPLIADIVPHYPESVDTFADALYEIQPTFVFTVPRYLQKFAAHLLVGLDQSSWIKRAAYRAAMTVGRRALERRWSLPSNSSRS